MFHDEHDKTASSNIATEKCGLVFIPLVLVPVPISLIRLALLVGVLFQQFLYGDEAVALFLQLRERLAKAFDGLAAVSAAVVHQDDVAGAGALDALGNNVGAGLLPVGGINVPADFCRYNAFKIGGNRSVKIAAWATENSVSS